MPTAKFRKSLNACNKKEKISSDLTHKKNITDIFSKKKTKKNPKQKEWSYLKRCATYQYHRPLAALQPSLFTLDQLIKTLLERMFSSLRFQKFASNKNGNLNF